MKHRRKFIYGLTALLSAVLLTVASKLEVPNSGSEQQPVQNLERLKDLDYDGVTDDIDQCLNTPALRKYNPNSKYAALYTKDELSDKPVSVPVDRTGCALDSDSDGVPDYQDYCPDNSPLEISKGVSPNGCSKHSDSDGTPDYRDKCPDTAIGVKTDRFGCPK